MTAVAAPAPALPPRGEARGRLSTPIMIGAAIGALVVIVLGALLVVSLLKPAKAHPACAFGQPCPPPKGQSRALRGTVWKSNAGFTIEYSSAWSVSQKSADTIVLESNAGAVVVSGKRGTDYKGLFDDKISTLERNLSLQRSNDPARALLRPNVGYQPGMGGDYCGNATSNQGGTVPVDTAAMAATKDGVSAFVAFVSVDCKKTDNSRKSPIAAGELGAADLLVNTFRWPSEAK
ncbi:MAG: hypothetical protein M3R70_09070 [Actinomycetota bacterium]|nr:hypothetical protein [Actinomycetota bacterium]